MTREFDRPHENARQSLDKLIENGTLDRLDFKPISYRQLAKERIGQFAEIVGKSPPGDGGATGGLVLIGGQGIVARLTSPPVPAYFGSTTSTNGNTGPRKHSGIFVSNVQCFGLLTQHRGVAPRQFPELASFGSHVRNKPKVRLGTNKPGRLVAVVAAEACLPLSMGGGFGFDLLDFGATAMTLETTFSPSTTARFDEAGLLPSIFDQLLKAANFARMVRLATATRFEEPVLEDVALALEVLEKLIGATTDQLDKAMVGASKPGGAEAESASQATCIHGFDKTSAEPSAQTALQKIQPLASEQQALIAVIDDLLSNTSFHGEVPGEFDQALWLMAGARRLSVELHALAYGLPMDIAPVHPASGVSHHG